MASEDDELDEIEEELARVEEEIQDLEEDLGESEAPDPEDPDVEAPEPEEALDDDADIEPEPSLVDKVKDRLASKEQEPDDEDEPDEAEEASEDDSGFLGGLVGSEDDEEDAEPDEDLEDEGTSEAEEAEEEALEADDTDRQAGSDDAPTSPSEDAEEEEVSEQPEEDEAEAEPDEEDSGFLGGLIGSDDEDDEDEEPEEDEAEAEPDDDDGGFLGRLIGSDADDEDEPDEAEEEEPDEESEPAGAEAGADEEALEAADDPSTSPSDEEAEADSAPSDDEDEEGPRASALLARFQDHEEPVEHPHQAEENDKRGLIVGGVLLLILLIAAAVGAYYFTQGSDGASNLSADLVANTVQGEDGGFIATTGQAVELDARGSNGSAEEYQWDFGDGNQETTSTPTVEHVYRSAGTYTVELTLVDGSDTASTTLEIQVIEAPTAQADVLLGDEPVAEPAQTGNNVFVGDEVALDGSGSTADPDHRLTSYTWDVDGDDEPDATGSSAQLNFDEAGRWVVALTVTDDLGNEATDERPVHVSNRRAQTETIGPSTAESDTDLYNVSVTPARLDVRPVELDLRLTYNSSSNDTGGLPIQPTVDSDLDLNVTDPDGTVYEAEDDAGQGNETLTVSGSDLAPLGEWTVAVSQDTTEGASAQEVDYRIVIETIY